MKRNIIVTGGASGIGLAITKKFAKAGDYVHVLEIDKDKAQENLSNLSHATKIHFCNVSDHDGVKKVMTGIANEGKIHALINNAGIAHIGNVEKTTEEDLDKLYSVNIKGVYNCIHATVPYMKKTGGGVIINMASVVSSVGIPERFAYSMTKGAVLTMTYSVAKDYVNDNIRCNSVSPARVHTPFVDGYLARNYPNNQQEMYDKLAKTQPIGRMGRPEEVASLVYFLCSDEASFLTGTDYPIDGGFIKINN